MNWLLVLLVAGTLQGEASVLGVPGYRAVADSMLARRESGAEWAEVLDAYYGYARPTEAAIIVAQQVITHPWASAGYPYAVSPQDAQRLGIKVERWVCCQDACIGLAKEWPTW
jgi:hypothetical protein